MSRLLIVNADDFGFTPDVNEGIIAAHRQGILTATTIMANGDAFDDAARRARQTPTLDIGCHLVLIGGRSLATGKPLPENVAQLVRALAARQIRPYAELRAQIEKTLAAGLEATHLDTHKHTHLAPPVLEAAARLGDEFNIRWVRRPLDFPLMGGPAPGWNRLLSRGLGLLRGRFHAVLERHGCRTTDHFAGFQLTGRLRTQELVELIRQLPPGLTEFMCHPGYCREPLRAAPTRLKQSREDELRALTAPEVWEALSRAGVQLASFRT
jgi:predicted glycoside hydrolase/deacetylase ChbG (UPF0249 family)